MSAAPLIMFLVFVVGVWLGPQQETQVVLLPDLDGSVGLVEVKTTAGLSQLSEARQMSRVTSGDRPPEVPVILNSAVIEREFAKVLAAEPPPPKKFLLYFLSGGSQLTAASEQMLPQIVAEIGQRESASVGVYGHSDSLGAAALNQKISLERAQAIAGLLEAAGVLPEVLVIDSHGEGNPLVPTADNVAEPRNRRVEVVVR